MALSTNSRILLVDDSPAILALLKDMLKQKGYRNVRTATGVKDALTLVQKEKPDVVFCDLMMPEQSGLDLTQEVLAIDPHIRVIITTALPPSHESVVMAISQGASEYLQKPIRKDAVTSVLDHVHREASRQDPSFYA